MSDRSAKAASEIVDAAEELRMAVFDYRMDPDNPAVLKMIADAPNRAFKLGYGYAREPREQPPSKWLN